LAGISEHVGRRHEPERDDAIKRLFKATSLPHQRHEVAAGVAALAGIVLLVTGGGCTWPPGHRVEGLKIAAAFCCGGLVCLQIVMPLITVGRLINAA